MKKLQLISLLIILLSCNQKQVEIPDKYTEFQISQQKLKMEYNYKNPFDSIQQIHKNFSQNCKSIFSQIDDYVLGSENWNICGMDKENFILKIYSGLDDQNFTEEYFVLDNRLIYAKETQMVYSNNKLDSTIWICEYIIENDSIINFESLGHGKTENENWNENEIINMYNSRKHILKKL